MMDQYAVMSDLDIIRIERALDELRQERRRLVDRIKALVRTMPEESQILGYLRGTENTSEAMLSLAKAHTGLTAQQDKNKNE